MTRNPRNWNPSMFSNLARRALLAAATTVGVAGCDGVAEPNDEIVAQPTAEADPEAVSDRSYDPCECLSGFWRCPSDSESFEYWQPQCPGESVPQAQTQCEAHCPATCVNLGWTDWCE
jgi:hypothetical protein